MSSPEQNAAYRNGFCIDCEHQRHSPGRTRCEQCHHNYTERMSRGEI